MTNLKSAVNGATNVTVDDLSEQITVLKNDIASLTSAVTEFSKAKGQAASDQVKATAADMSAAGRAKALEAQASAEEFVRTQPTAALGIAAGVGFIVGLMTVRR